MNEALNPGGPGHYDPHALVPAPPALIVPRVTFDGRKMQLLKDVIAKGCDTVELELFTEVCKRTGMDPFARQIYAIKRGGVMTIQMSIDGFRLVAERSGRYRGQLGPYWCGEDGEWREVWVEAENPVAAKIGVLRADFAEPLWATARFKSYYQDVGPMWNRMPDLMIAKCAEALALRRAFPNDLSSIYASEEMDQADTVVGSAQLAAPAVPVDQAPPEKKTTRAPRRPAAAKPAASQAPSQEAATSSPEPSTQAAPAPAGMQKIGQPTMGIVRALLASFGGNEERLALVRGIEPAAVTKDSLGNDAISLGSLTQDQGEQLAEELKRRAQASAK